MADQQGYVSKVLWNIDSARLENVSEYLKFCEFNLHKWHLEECFSALDMLVTIISGKLDIKEFDECEKQLNSMNLIRSRIDNTSSKYDDTRTLLRSYERKLLIYIQRLLVKHGLFFRGSNSPDATTLETD